MSIYFGDEAITYLAKKSQQKDIKSSSHWDNYHSDFGFEDGKFSGLLGFGGLEKRSFGLRKMMHYFLQNPFRKMADSFSDFDAINETAKDILSKQNKSYSLDVLRQVITLAYLNDKKVVKEGMCCVIGDGFATMTSLLLKHNKQRVVLVNLTKTLLVDIWYLKLLLGDKFNTDLAIATSKDDMLRVLSKTENKPPFYRNYEGPIRHRLVKFS